MSIEGYCECGRKSTGKFSYRRNEQYCSKYCHDFMEIKVDGEKTAYDLWYGTGKYALNPPYPKLTMKCAWCEGEGSLPMFKTSQSQSQIHIVTNRFNTDFKSNPNGDGFAREEG